jgi:NADH:ubiquinone oxidoreductase subunit 5 (subunit L)/multisubunit Na+/H+ antiporter MnhA subunit
MLVNRVGDFGLALGIMTSFSVFKSVNFATIFASTPFLANTNILFFNHSFDTLTLISVCVFVGALALAVAVGKSAQERLMRGLHTWLPDAMECPTPVFFARMQW